MDVIIPDASTPIGGSAYLLGTGPANHEPHDAAGEEHGQDVPVVGGLLTLPASADVLLS